MADINIKKKDNTPLWPWVIGVLAIVGLSVWLFTGNNDRTDSRVASTTEIAPEAAPPNPGQGAGPAEEENFGSGSGTVTESDAYMDPIEEYVLFVRDEDIASANSIDYEVTAEGIRKLGAALNTVVDKFNTNVDANQLRNKFNQKASQLQQNPNATATAGILSEAFVSAADVIVLLQEKHYPQLANEAKEVKETANEIKPREPATRQSTQVRAFFRKSSEVLDEMAKEQTAANTSTNNTVR